MSPFDHLMLYVKERYNMGCFSVSCGITSAAIYSQEAVMLLLVEEPKCKDYDDKYGNRWGYIPVVIRGTCDTYGGLDDIQETPGTKILEKYFGVPIAQLCGIATNRREKTCYLSDTFALGVPDIRKALQSYDVKFDEAFLELLDFKLNEEGFYVHPNFPKVTVKLLEAETRSPGHNDRMCRPYEMNGILSNVGQQNKQHLIEDFEKLTGYSLLFAKDDQLKVQRLELLSHVMFDAQAWDAFAHYDIDEDGEIIENYLADTWCTSGYAEHLLKLGFVKDPESNGHGRYNESWRHPSSDEFFVMSDGQWGHLSKMGTLSDHGVTFTYSVKHLMVAWKKLTGTELELPPEEHQKTTFDFYFERFANDVRKLEETKDRHRYSIRYLLGDSQRYVTPHYEYANWEYFVEIFKDGILDGSIQPEARACARVRGNMRSVGKLFQPDTGGYQPQCGDYHALKRLGEVTLAIAERELAEREEYEDDEDE